MDLQPELPTALGPVSLRQLGLEHTRYPCLDLGAMVSLPSPHPAPSVVGVLQPRACVWVSPGPPGQAQHSCSIGVCRVNV